MAIAGRFSGDRFEIERLTATAGDGTVSAQGYVSLAEASGYPMNVEVALDDARLARSDALSATATGNLRLAKAAGQTALLSGEITLPETRYEIIRQGSAQVPELTGVRFKPPGTVMSRAEKYVPNCIVALVPHFIFLLPARPSLLSFLLFICV